MRVLDAFARFIWSEMVFVAGIGLLIAAMISGALMSDLGLADLFHPTFSGDLTTPCAFSIFASGCLRLLKESPLRNPCFQVGALYVIFTGLLQIFWVRREREAGRSEQGARLLFAVLSLSVLLPIIPLTSWGFGASGDQIEIGRTRIEVLQFVCGCLFGLAVSLVWIAASLKRLPFTTTWMVLTLGMSLVAFFVYSNSTTDALFLFLSLAATLSLVVRYFVWRLIVKLQPARRAGVIIVGLGAYAVVSELHSQLPVIPGAVRPYRIAEIDLALNSTGNRSDIRSKCIDFTGAVYKSNNAPVGGQGSHPPARLIAPTDALAPYLTGRVKPKLVVIAASGGAYRATFWTAAVIDVLLAESGPGERVDGLANSIVLLTGASGGGVAIAYFIAGYDKTWIGKKDALSSFIAHDMHSIAPAPDTDPDRIDSLQSVADHLIRHDLRDVVLRRRCGEDRGRILERQWPALDKLTFAQLARRDAERLATTDSAFRQAPQAIFQPMIVQTGEPLYITNLDLPAARSRRVSLLEYLPGSQQGLTLASAARLSATFPFITPSIDVPLPAQRVAGSPGVKTYRILTGTELASGVAVDEVFDGQIVDAGYFDNQGVDAAASFLLDDEVVKAIVAHDAKVIVIEIRAQVEPESTPNVPLSRWLEAVERPISAYVSASTRGAILRADRTWALVGARLGTDPAGVERLERFTFSNYRFATVAMTWFIDTVARRALKDEMRADRNVTELNRLAAAFRK